jgi:hypothetical protein
MGIDNVLEAKMMMLIYSLSLAFLLLSTFLSTVTFAQTSPTANSTAATSAPTSSNVSSTASTDQAKIEKLEKIPSLSKIVAISLVEGIKVSGINIGDTDLTLTLTRQADGTNLASPGNTSSLPVTVIVTKLPVSNLTQVISASEAAKSLSAASSTSDPTSSLLGGTSPSASSGSAALEVLSVLKDLQIGTASIVNANWTTPQTISMGLLGTRNDTPAPSELVLVTVIPFQGVSNLATLPLK